MTKYFNKDTTYQKVKDILQQKSIEYYRNSTKNLIRLGLSSLDKLDDKKSVLSYIKRVDNAYTSQFQQKLPTILYGLTIMTLKDDFAKQISIDALMLYSHEYCHNEPTMENINYSISLTTPDILETICKKTNDIIKRECYYAYAQHIYENSSITDKEKRSEYVCNEIRNMNEDDYNQINDIFCSYEAFEDIPDLGIKI